MPGLVPPQRLVGTWRGNGCCLTPRCLVTKVEVEGSGLCVYQYCGGASRPFHCMYMAPCCDRCYASFARNGQIWWPIDDRTIDLGCGAAIVRSTAPVLGTMDRNEG